jgi:protease-4
VGERRFPAVAPSELEYSSDRPSRANADARPANDPVDPLRRTRAWFMTVRPFFEGETMFRRSCLAFAVGAALLFNPAALWAGGGNDAQESKTATKPTVAVFRLDGPVTEAPSGEELLAGLEQKSSLKELTERLDKAATDANVKGVVFLLEGAGIGTAQREELRQSMAKLRKAGKEIFAHADSLSMGDYALLAGASRLSVVPTADLWVNGFYAEQPYIRGLLDLLGAQPDFLTCGEYKSAAELFMRKEPSPQADKMMNWLFDGIFDTYVGMIASGRGVDNAKAKEWIDKGPYSARTAKEAGLIDAIEHRQAFEAEIKKKLGDTVAFDKKYGEKNGPDLKLGGGPLEILKVFSDLMGGATKKKSTKPAVAIIYVEGGITLGSKKVSLFGGEEGAYSSDIRKALDEAARDDAVKAVVLRVDSPGGSAVASEIILDATRRVKAKKPFVVSMGNVAASGGYYVSCASDVIYADEATITASIGVVAGKLNTAPTFGKVGITFKPYQRGENAGILAGDHTFTNSERQRMQSWMDEIYGVFKGHVTASRGDRLKKPIDELAGGRVFTGKQALDLGLVDRIGTMQDAITHIAGQAKLTDYEVRVVPEPKNLIEQIMEATGGGKDDKSHLDVSSRGVKVSGPSLVELAAPHLKGMDPQRARVILRSLRQLETLQREGVNLMMPEFLVK